jgi:hypothetical protein
MICGEAFHRGLHSAGAVRHAGKPEPHLDAR